MLRQLFFYCTPYCNLKCLHCWIDPLFINDKEIDGINLIDFLNFIDSAKELGLSSVKLTGGEPFLRKDILELVSELKKRNISIIIETNGVLITEKQASVLKENEVFLVVVSLDSSEPEVHDRLRGVKGSFELAVKGIKALEKYQLPIQIITCLYKENFNHIEELILLAKQLGASSFKINPINSMGRAGGLLGQDLLPSIQEIIELYQYLEKKMESIPLKIIFDIPPAFKTLRDIKSNGLSVCGISDIVGLLSDGTISICGIGRHYDDLVMGNIKTDSIKDIWENHRVFKKIREEIPDRLEGICRICLMKRYCLGKCRAEAYHSYGNLLAALPFCQKAYEQGLFPSLRLAS